MGFVSVGARRIGDRIRVLPSRVGVGAMDGVED